MYRLRLPWAWCRWKHQAFGVEVHRLVVEEAPPVYVESSKLVGSRSTSAGRRSSSRTRYLVSCRVLSAAAESTRSRLTAGRASRSRERAHRAGSVSSNTGRELGAHAVASFRIAGTTASSWARAVRGTLAHVDRGRQHEVELQHDEVPHLRTEKTLQGRRELGAVGVGAVQGDVLPLAAGCERRMVDHKGDGHEDCRAPGRAGTRGQAGDESEGKRDEVVGDLLLGDRRRPQPDDRQDAEEPETEADPGGALGQQCGHREHPDVEREIRRQEVPACSSAGSR